MPGKCCWTAAGKVLERDCVYIKDYVIVLEQRVGKRGWKSADKRQKQEQHPQWKWSRFGLSPAFVSDAIMARKCCECEINRKTALMENLNKIEERKKMPIAIKL